MIKKITKTILRCLVVFIFVSQVTSVNAQYKNDGITSKGVDGLTLGMSLYEIRENYKTTYTFAIEGEGGIRPYVIVGDNDFKLGLEYDRDYGYQTRIDEIIVMTPNVKTSDGVHVGTTIKEFFTIYPDAMIGYSYISEENGLGGGVELYSKSNPNSGIQFYLDFERYQKKIEINSDWVKLDYNGFAPDTPIEFIRITKPY